MMCTTGQIWNYHNPGLRIRGNFVIHNNRKFGFIFIKNKMFRGNILLLRQKSKINQKRFHLVYVYYQYKCKLTAITLQRRHQASNFWNELSKKVNTTGILLLSIKEGTSGQVLVTIKHKT